MRLHHYSIHTENDLTKGFGEVYMPYALARKYPNASKERCWQCVFPASTLSTDPRSVVARHHHIDSIVINKAIQDRILVKTSAPGIIRTWPSSPKKTRSFCKMRGFNLDNPCWFSLQG